MDTSWLWQSVGPGWTMAANNYNDHPLVLLVAALLAAAAGCSWYQYKFVFNYWRERGIKGPRPWPIVGNQLNISLSNQMKVEKDWARKYGKVYGVYRGLVPRLMVADVEVFRQICIKDFDTFAEHEHLEYLSTYQKNFLVWLKHDHWKRVRALTSPTFTSGKIKRMFRLFDACADDLVQCFEEQLVPSATKEKRGSTADDNRPLSAIVDLKSTFSLYTLDSISNCCYGIRLERAGAHDIKTVSTKDEFARLANKVFNFELWRIVAWIAVPGPILRAFGFEILTKSNVEPFAQRVKRLIWDRRRSGRKFEDYLQLLMDARLEDQLELNEMDLKENHHAGLSSETLLKNQTKMVHATDAAAAAGNANVTGGKTTGVLDPATQEAEMTDLELMSAAALLMVVGTETTSNFLTACAYTLAFHPDVQERLHEELVKIVEFSGEDRARCQFEYEALTSCEYLDSVVAETMRLLPPALLSDRESLHDYRIEKLNLELPAKSKVGLALYAILNDPDLWQEPDKFNPDRFMPGEREKITPGAYCPFGIGPRYCVGMRFALTEIKVGLAKLLMRFRFEPAPNTKFPPTPKLGIGLMLLRKPLVRVVPRH